MRSHAACGFIASLTAVLTAACGGRTDETPPPLASDLCYPPFDPGPTSPRACTGDVSSCDPGSDNCLSSALAVTVRSLVVACGAYCGELAMGVRDGCASDLVIVNGLGGDGLRSQGDIIRCIENKVLGRRWACASADRWYRAYIGSCTTP